MRVLVTGAAGFIGTHTIVALLERGHDVVGLDSFVSAKRAAVDSLATVVGRTVEVVEADIRDGAALRGVLRQGAFDGVLHCAGLKSVEESLRRPLAYYDANVVGSLRLIEALREAGVPRIVFSSSATVYHRSAVSPTPEDAPTGPTNPYGQTKLHVEQVLRDVAGADPGFGAAVLRYFNPIGAHESGLIGEDPRGRPANLFPFVAQVAAGRLTEVVVRGGDYDTPDGTGVRDFLHVMDLAHGQVAALEWLADHRGFDLWNLGTGLGTSVLQVVAAFGRASGHPVPYRIEGRRAGDVAVSVADATRAGRELAWTPTRSLDDACRDLWNWQTKNPGGYPDQ